VDEWMDVTIRVLQANKLRSAYVRPLVFRGYNTLGVDGRSCPVDAIVATVPWGRYLGTDAIENGIDVQVSSWRRMAPNMFSPMAKIGGQYISSQNIVIEAKDNGFTEGIALDGNGQISEGSGENIFIIHKGVIYTPPMSSSILGGITRDSAITIAKDLGYEVKESSMSREMLYLADEIFFTGTAAEITPVRSVDRMPVDDGKRGPITKAVQEVFFGIVEDGAPDKWDWLTHVKLG